MSRTDNDIELVQRAMEGDHQAFSELAERARSSLLASGRQWLGDSYLAEEVAQVSLIRAYEHLEELRHPAAFHGWLLTIARNVARQLHRSQERLERVGPTSIPCVPPVPDYAHLIELRDALRQATAGLPSSQHGAVELCLFQGYSCGEAAERLSLPPQVVKGRLQRARAALRKELSEIMPVEKKKAVIMPEKKKAVGKPPWVLVVDDELSIVRLLKVNLRWAGYRVASASDGVEALEQAQRLRPHLILTNNLMPRMNGWELVRALRSRKETLLTPIVVLSAVESSDPRNAIHHELADIYIQKPFDPGQLLAWIDRRLGRLTAEQCAELAAWRAVRFCPDRKPEVVAEHLGSQHYYGIQCEATQTLRQMGAAAVAALADVACRGDSAAWRAAVYVLGERSEPEAVAALARLLRHEDRDHRWEALATLGGMARSSIEALTAIAEEGASVFQEVAKALDDSELQREAVTVLGRLRTPESVAALRKFARRAKSDIKELVRGWLPSV